MGSAMKADLGSCNLASHYKLDNILAIVDRNGLQIDGPTEKSDS